MQCTLHAGEVEVFVLLLKQAIPKLSGWDTLMDMQLRRNANTAKPAGGNRKNNFDETMSADGNSFSF